MTIMLQIQLFLDKSVWVYLKSICPVKRSPTQFILYLESIPICIRQSDLIPPEICFGEYITPFIYTCFRPLTAE